jgi:hypothetical protein
MSDPKWRGITWNFHPLGKRGELYPRWLRDLIGEHGIYIIKEGSTIVYIGESHAGRLYGTITRHFQRWTRSKDYHKGQYVEATNDPGLTYDRAACRVAYYVTKTGESAIEMQDRAIAHFEPRDNVQGKLPF